MKKLLAVLIAMGMCTAVPAVAVPILFQGSTGNLAASASFDEDASGNLIVVLTNTSVFDARDPANILTAVFFTSDDATLTPVSALLTLGSAVYNGPSGGGNVGGEWAYVNDMGSPYAGYQGISSSGLGLFGSANFNGPDLQAPAAVNGLQYGITSAGDNPGTGNTPLFTNALIRNSVTFTLSGWSGSLGSISGVTFQYGTSLNEPHLRVSEPGTLLLIGSGLLGIGLMRRRRRD